ncbi:type II secretion system F family protein [Poriferisphaera sp. WC338]|uniref:type II secretion system F family protein n=1 Tax=Poriferisphaera sp. WC338 TaxID=3425129 RepID=UPI003D8166D8
MAQYKYKARDRHGKLQTGLISAVTKEDAGRMLHGEGKFVVALDVASTFSQSDDDVAGGSGGKIKRADVITFAHQLAVMIETGVPIAEALECVSSQSPNEAFREVVKDISERVQSGSEFSAALGAYPRIFPPVMVSLIRASEMSGTMGVMLDRISNYMQKEAQTAKKIKSALTYPVVMIAVALGVMVFLLTWVLPRFSGIYASKGAALPMPTQMLITMSDMLIGYWWAWLLGMGALIVGYIITSRNEQGKRTIDYVKLHLPILGPLFNKLYITRGCRTMGTMINAGVPILDMVGIVREVTTNRLYDDFWDETDEMLRRGTQLSEAMFNSKLIPRSVSQMIYSGEKSGRLGQVLERVAEYTEVEFDDQVKTTTQFIEPAMIAIMGCVIGFVAIALLLPIFSVGKVMSGG